MCGRKSEVVRYNETVLVPPQPPVTHAASRFSLKAAMPSFASSEWKSFCESGAAHAKASARPICGTRATSLLRGGERRGAAAHELGEELGDGGVEAVAGHRAVDEADGGRARGGHALAREEELARVGAAQLRQAHHRDHRRAHAEAHLGEADQRVVGDDRDVARRRQPDAAAVEPGRRCGRPPASASR